MTFIDRLVMGEVIKDFGPVHEKRWFVGRETQGVLLVRKQGRLRFVLKRSIVTWIGLSVTYIDLELDEAYQLRDCINQMEAFVKNQATGLEATPSARQSRP
jgi:hypothetical protein